MTERDLIMNVRASALRPVQCKVRAIEIVATEINGSGELDLERVDRPVDRGLHFLIRRFLTDLETEYFGDVHEGIGILLHGTRLG